jgi:hypothetical protein
MIVLRQKSEVWSGTVTVGPMVVRARFLGYVGKLLESLDRAWNSRHMMSRWSRLRCWRAEGLDPRLSACTAKVTVTDEANLASCVELKIKLLSLS